MNRRLVLRRQPLAELTPDELSGVAGADQITPQCSSTPLRICTSTLPLNQCFISLNPCNVDNEVGP